MAAFRDKLLVCKRNSDIWEVYFAPNSWNQDPTFNFYNKQTKKNLNYKNFAVPHMTTKVWSKC